MYIVKRSALAAENPSKQQPCVFYSESKSNYRGKFKAIIVLDVSY